MSATVKAPALTSESVLRLVGAAGRDGTTLAMLAEDLDVASAHIGLKLTVAGLVGECRIRWVVRGGRDVLVVKR